MRTAMKIAATQARQEFSTLLDLVLTGERVTITRNGRPAVVMSRHDQANDLESAMKHAGESPATPTPGANDGGP